MAVDTLTPHPPGLVHGVGFYSSDDDFLRRFLPFCQEGLDQGDPVVVRVEPRNAALLRSALEDPDRAVFTASDDQYRHPAVALANVLELVRHHPRNPSRPLRLLGELPVLTGLARDVWLRYEAAVNQALDRLPVQALCAFDTRSTSPTVQAEVLRTHHAVASPTGVLESNSCYERPDAFEVNRVEVVCDPLERTPPDVDLADPDPATARHALRCLAGTQGLDRAVTGDILVCANETLTNAILHGKPPVRLRAWGRAGRVVVSVSDAGPGPCDALAGLLPPDSTGREGGRGLWITHQLCAETAMSVTDQGFTIRLAFGEPAAGQGRSTRQSPARRGSCAPRTSPAS